MRPRGCVRAFAPIFEAGALMDGAVAEAPEVPTDAGAGTSNAVTCKDNCDFAKVCIADNALAAALVADVVTGLNADEPEARVSSCRSDVGGDGSADPV